MSGSTILTPEGQRLADALVKAEILWEAPHGFEPFIDTIAVSELNAAALLLTAPEGEGAGPREALRQIVRIHNDPTPADQAIVHIVRVARAALASEGKGEGVREAYARVFNDFTSEKRGNALWAEISRFRDYHDGCEAKYAYRFADALLAALASPQPAVEGPVATGVERNELIMREARRREILIWIEDRIGTGWTCDRCNHSTYHANAVECADCGEPMPDLHVLAFKLHAVATEDTDLLAEVRAEFDATAAFATLTPPADPKPTVPGNDAGMRYTAGAMDMRDRAADAINAMVHERFSDGTAPLVQAALGEATMMVRALHLAPQTGSAGEAPKTQDAATGGSVGDGGLREAKDDPLGRAGTCRVPMWSAGSPSGFCGNAAFGPQYPRDYLAHVNPRYTLDRPPYCSGPCCSDHGGPSEGQVVIFQDGTTSTGRQMWCAVMPDFVNLQESEAAFDLNPVVAANRLAAALAQPAPVGEDKTGVREALKRTELERDEALSASRLSDRIAKAHAERAQAAEAALAALAPQPPKAETPAGVGQGQPVVWVIPGSDTAGADGFVDAMCFQHGEFTRPLYAALSAAPAARPGDGVERVLTEDGLRELQCFVRAVKALMRHINPTNVNEGHAQQWFAVSDAISNKVSPLLDRLAANGGSDR